MGKKEVTIDPKSDLGKLLLALVQSVGSMDPQAFVKTDVAKAIKQADALAGYAIKPLVSGIDD